MSVITIIIIIIRGGSNVLFNYHEYYVLQNNRSDVGGSVFNVLSCIVWCGRSASILTSNNLVAPYVD